MPLPLPPLPDTTAEILAWNKVERLNQAEKEMGNQFIGAYEEFWGVQSPPKGSRHTTAEMQAAINKMPQETALAAIQKAEQFISVYGSGIELRYHTPAFEITIHNGSTIVVGDLKAVWQAPVESPQSEAI